MKLYSEMLSTIMKILLWALVGCASIVFICTVIYTIDVDFYIDYAYSLDGFIEVVSSVLYYIILVIYLIWIYRVHMDLKDIFPFYQRSPGMALACMMVPFFNFYGIPSTYSRIGNHLESLPAAHKQGRIISGLAAPLIILFLVSSILNRVISKSATEPSSTLLLLSTLGGVVLYIVFLTLCIQVSQGLKNARTKTPEEPVEFDLTPPADWVSTNIANNAGPIQKS